jgi:3-deoxy-manno-octulosonate cytidylyltransferase (CMP-KDO synthetase)
MMEKRTPSFLVVIPARLASTRLPRKPLVSILGKTLIQRTCEQVEMAVSRENFLVATDSVEIFNHIEGLGYRAMITSERCLTGTDRVAEIAAATEYDYYINVQGDEPLINPEDIKKVIANIGEHPGEIINGYAVLLEEEEYRSRSIPKVVFRPDGRLLYMSRAPIPGSKVDDFQKAWRQICIYSFPKKLLNEFTATKNKSILEEVEDIEILRFLEMGYEIRMVQLSDVSIAVDNPEDIDKVIKRLNE